MHGKALSAGRTEAVADGFTETAFRWFVYDYEDPLFGSHWWEAAAAIPAGKPLKLLKLGKAANLWGKADTLADHFARHGVDVGARNADEYVQMGSEFLQRSQVNHLPTKIDSRGVIRVYDPQTNTFGAYNPDGSIRTFYKPDPNVHGYPTNLDYWNAQKGVAP